MNTRLMFEGAQNAFLIKHQLMAHIIWALVSQAGTRPMTVGEVANLVKSTSGVKPSTYQVKKQMDLLHDMRGVYFSEAGIKGLGRETRYSATQESISALCCYSFGLVGSDVHAAALGLIESVTIASSAVIASLCEYNQSLYVNDTAAYDGADGNTDD